MFDRLYFYGPNRSIHIKLLLLRRGRLSKLVSIMVNKPVASMAEMHFVMMLCSFISTWEASGKEFDPT